MNSKSTDFDTFLGSSCTECGSSELEHEAGEISCRSCGEILQEHSINSQEMKIRSEDWGRKSTRFGGRVTYGRGDQGFRTTLGNTIERSKNTRKNHNFWRLKKINDRNTNEERKRKPIIENIRYICETFNLPEPVRHESNRLAFKLVDEKNIQGKRRELTSLAIVNIVSRDMGYGIPRKVMTENTFERMFDEKDLGERYRVIARKLDMDFRPLKPRDMVYRYFERFDLSQKKERKVIELLEKCDGNYDIQGLSPISVIAGCIYIIDRQFEGNGLNQATISERMNVTSVTVRKAYQRIEDNFDVNKIAPTPKASV